MASSDFAVPTSGVIRGKTRQGALTHIITAAIVFIIWYVVTLFTPKYLFPTPIAVLKEMWEIVVGGTLWGHAAYTLLRVLVAMIGTMIVGTAIGVLMGINSYWERFGRNWVYMALSMPGVVWAMLAVLWFGINEVAIFLAVVLIVFPYISVIIFEGVKSVDKALIDVARAYRVRRSVTIRKVIVPSLIPYIVAAVRQNFAHCWKMVTLAELFGATKGVGYMIRVHFDFFSIAGIIAWTGAFAIIILVIEYGIILPIRNRLLSWRPEVGEIF